MWADGAAFFSIVDFVASEMTPPISLSYLLSISNKVFSVSEIRSHNISVLLELWSEMFMKVLQGRS